jgi:uncharacterized protein YcbK (DUF882 family)
MTETRSSKTNLSRRSLVLGALAAPLVLASHRASASVERVLAFQNLHTGESLRSVYCVNGHYVKQSLGQINYILRDFRTGDIRPIDRELLDALVRLQRRLGTRQPIQIISGYRSPKTNAMLASTSEGVARNSFHIKGQAIDLRLEGIALSRLRNAAKSLQVGGVGYYPGSEFIHMDTGPIRYW